MDLNADITKVGTLPFLRAFAGNQNDYVSPYLKYDLGSKIWNWLPRTCRIKAVAVTTFLPSRKYTNH